MNQTKISYIYCFSAIFFFSTIELVGKLIGKGISPLLITAYRFLIGGLVLLPFSIRYRRKLKFKLQFSDYLNMAYPGVINVAISMMFLQLAVYFGKASLAGILVSTNPLFVAVFAYLLLKENLDRYKVMGIVVGLCGIFLIIMGEKQLVNADSNILFGILFGFLAALTFGFNVVLSKKYIKRYGNFLFNTVAFFSGAIVLLIAGLILGIDLTFAFGLKNWLYLVYLGLFVTGFAYILFFEGLKHITAATGSMFFFLKPALASIFAVLILHEHLSSWQVVGIVLIIISLNTDRLRNTHFSG
jgi:drug/metabolite transporter (DMT)-like permease